IITMKGAATVRHISMRKISEVLRQYHELKYSHRKIARSLNLGKTTVTRYLSLANAAQLAGPCQNRCRRKIYTIVYFCPQQIRPRKKPCLIGSGSVKSCAKKVSPCNYYGVNIAMYIKKA